MVPALRAGRSRYYIGAGILIGRVGLGVITGVVGSVLVGAEVDGAGLVGWGLPEPGFGLEPAVVGVGADDGLAAADVPDLADVLAFDEGPGLGDALALIEADG